jgi:hypothetical protein
MLVVVTEQAYRRSRKAGTLFLPAGTECEKNSGQSLIIPGENPYATLVSGVLIGLSEARTGKEDKTLTPSLST